MILIVAVAAVGLLYVEGAPRGGVTSTTSSSATTQLVGISGYSGRTWKVPQDYQSIDSAITVAAPGDTILVSAGRYSGFTINKAVQVVGFSNGTTAVTGPISVEGDGAALVYLSATDGISVTGDRNIVTNNTIEYSSQTQFIPTLSIQGGGNTIAYNQVTQGVSTFLACQGPTCYNPWVSVQGTSNTVKGNLISGVGSSSIGLLMTSSNTVTGNMIACSSFSQASYGMSVSSFAASSDSNRITGNEVMDCSLGIYVTGNVNTIAGNNFVNNRVQAEDDGNNNVWTSGGQGNYWSDWSNPSLPYPISGTARSSDPNPLAAPVMVAVIPTQISFNIQTACAGVKSSLVIESVVYSPISGDVAIAFSNNNPYSISWLKVGMAPYGSSALYAVNQIIPSTSNKTIALTAVGPLTISGETPAQLNGTAWELYLELRPSNIQFPAGEACTAYPKTIYHAAGVSASSPAFYASYFGANNTGKTFVCTSSLSQVSPNGASLILTNKGTTPENVTFIALHVQLSSTSIAYAVYYPVGGCLIGSAGSSTQTMELYFPAPTQFGGAQVGQSYSVTVSFSDGTRTAFTGQFL